jgi:hypothetical protein
VAKQGEIIAGVPGYYGLILRIRQGCEGGPFHLSDTKERINHLGGRSPMSKRPISIAWPRMKGYRKSGAEAEEAPRRPMALKP